MIDQRLMQLSLQLVPLLEKYGLLDIVECLASLQDAKARVLCSDGNLGPAAELLGCKQLLEKTAGELPGSRRRIKAILKRLCKESKENL